MKRKVIKKPKHHPIAVWILLVMGFISYFYIANIASALIENRQVLSAATQSSR